MPRSRLRLPGPRGRHRALPAQHPALALRGARGQGHRTARGRGAGTAPGRPPGTGAGPRLRGGPAQHPARHAAPGVPAPRRHLPRPAGPRPPRHGRLGRLHPADPRGAASVRRPGQTAHRARPFLPQAPPSGLLEELREQVRAEGAELHVVDDSADRRRLAELVRAGEDAHRTDARLAAEQAGWTWRLAQPRNDGVPADVGVLHPDCTTLAGRDYAGLTGMFPTPPRRWPARTGLVVLLGTDRDDLAAWLRAGQALERMLLQAAAHGVMAAFHTQPLEVPHLRRRIRQTLTAGQYPQMVLRLGHPPCVRPLPRRPVTDVLG
ncbi:nitroreductase family protein [Streptomyces sp. Tue 6430]|nr:nitroreductase family protein [Streptomyces sp. Tue 6430]